VGYKKGFQPVSLQKTGWKPVLLISRSILIGLPQVEYRRHAFSGFRTVLRLVSLENPEFVRLPLKEDQMGDCTEIATFADRADSHAEN